MSRHSIKHRRTNRTLRQVDRSDTMIVYDIVKRARGTTLFFFRFSFLKKTRKSSAYDYLPYHHRGTLCIRAISLCDVITNNNGNTVRLIGESTKQSVLLVLLFLLWIYLSPMIEMCNTVSFYLATFLPKRSFTHDLRERVTFVAHSSSLVLSPRSVAFLKYNENDSRIRRRPMITYGYASIISIADTDSRRLSWHPDTPRPLSSL